MRAANSADRRRLTEIIELAAHFVEQADARVGGAGDFDAYHSARHNLVMALDTAFIDSPQAEGEDRTDIVITVDSAEASSVERLVLSMLETNSVTALVRCLVGPPVTDQIESYSTNSIGPRQHDIESEDLAGWALPDTTLSDKVDVLGHMIDFLFLQLVEHCYDGDAQTLRASLTDTGKQLLDHYVSARLTTETLR